MFRTLLSPTEAVCTGCHNAESPTWKSEKYTLPEQKLFDFVEEGEHNEAIYSFYDNFVEDEEETEE